MIITKTPFRISFAGGGSDFPYYYEQFGGSVLSVTINKYMYQMLHPFFNKNECLIKYSQTEQVKNIKEIRHPIIKTIFEKYQIENVEFNSTADIPSGTGLASSSAFTVGMINLCNAYVNKYMSKKDVAELACNIEMVDLQQTIGKQDQYACSCGGLNFISFQKSGLVNVEKLYLKDNVYKAFEHNLLMFYTGVKHNAPDILDKQKDNILLKNKKLINNLHKMVSLSENLKKELLNDNISVIGDILHNGWVYKKELSPEITNDKIDYYYNVAIKAGADGGKLLGAGGGGFLLFYVKEEYQESVRKSLHDLNEIDFKFDNKGTHVIYYDNIPLYKKGLVVG